MGTCRCRQPYYVLLHDSCEVIAGVPLGLLLHSRPFTRRQLYMVGGGLWRSQSTTAVESSKGRNSLDLFGAETVVLPHFLRVPAAGLGPIVCEAPSTPQPTSPWSHLWSVQEEVLEKEAPKENIVFEAPRRLRSEKSLRPGGSRTGRGPVRSKTASPAFLVRNVDLVEPSRRDSSKHENESS